MSGSQKDDSQKNLPLPKRKAYTHAVPLLDEDEISELAKRFAEAIPEDELSVRVTGPRFKQGLTVCIGSGCKFTRIPP